MSEQDIQAEISKLADAELLDVLKNGQQVMLKDGTVTRVRPSAAYMKTIFGRLKDCGVQSEVNSNTDLGQVFLRLSERKLPDLDDQDDVATA